MTLVTKVIKSVGPKLVPFFKTLTVYFVIFIPHNQPSLLATVLKCLPIMSLIIFVLLHGMSLGNEYQYSRKIIAGLIFSCIGDAFLVWPQYFCLGMLSFGIAHLNYISAFGMKPLNLPLGFFLYFVNILGIMYVIPDLHGIFIPGVIIYSIILTGMVWRAIARVQFFEDLWTWSKLCTCAGGISFAISDFLISIDQFKYKIEYAQALIMATYYAAQLGLVLSIVDYTTKPDKPIKTKKLLENENKGE